VTGRLKLLWLAVSMIIKMLYNVVFLIEETYDRYFKDEE
jgi:hypothetical protein